MEMKNEQGSVVLAWTVGILVEEDQGVEGGREVKLGSRRLKESQGRSTRSGIIPSLCILCLHLLGAHGPSHRLGHTPSFRDLRPTAPSPGFISKLLYHIVLELSVHTLVPTHCELLEDKGLVLLPWCPQHLWHMQPSL